MKRIKRILLSAVSATAASASMIITANAADLASSTIGVGIKNILSDLSSFGMVIGPTVGGAAAIYFLIRRSMADEQDGKMWTRRITIAVICGVAVLLVSGIISLVSSYF